MNINPTGPSTPTPYIKQTTARTNSYPTTGLQDQVHTSKPTLALSRALATLKTMSLPREEIIQKFSKDMDRPMKLNDDVIDRILNQL